MELQIHKVDTDELVVTLRLGEHVFGRGPLLQCNDTRISRKHGVFTVTYSGITITSTHTNPCFYKAASGSILTILHKDRPVKINDGDMFALLPDKFWFKLRIAPAKPESPKKPTPFWRVLSYPEAPSWMSGKPITVNIEIDDDSVREPQIDDDGEDNALLMVPSPPANGANEHDPGERNAGNSNRVNKNVEKESNSEDTNRGNENSEKERNAEDTIIIDEDDEEESTANNNAKHASESGDERSTEAKKIKLEEMENASNTSADAAGASASGGDINNTGRERCWYGATCYRTNPNHRLEYSHPDDPDYNDVVDNRPTCSYGHECYRRNPDHRKEFKHLCAPKDRPSTTEPKKPKNPAARKARGKTPAYVDNASDEDEYDLEDPFIDNGTDDEYEAFTDSEESDSGDEDGGEDDNVNLKRLMKEAKRFTRGKKQ